MVTGVSLDKSTLNLAVDRTATLTPTVDSALRAANKSVTWATSNSAIATVDENGLVTAVGEGTATITVTTTDQNKTAECDVIVTAAPPAVESVTLDKTVLNLNVDGTETLTATVLPDTADQTVTWTSSDEAVATVDETGVVTAVGEGTATITAATVDPAIFAECTVNVTVPVTGVALNQAAADMTVGGDTLALKATVSPDNATDQTVTWTSSDEAVATVDETGVVTAVGEGTATITAATVDPAIFAECTVNVTVPVTGVALNQTAADMTVGGGTLALKATVSPDNATDQTVTWTSSDEAVATVVDGTVTAVGEGTAIITAATVDGGKAATCAVNVTVPVTGVALNQTAADMTVGGSALALKATVSPDNATDQTVTWTSSDETVATVDTNGAVTAVGEGTATITAATVDPAIFAECTVNVTVPVTGVALNQTAADMTVGGGTLALKATVSPDNATNKAVTWTTSDETVATVDETGVVTAVGAGTAIITAATVDPAIFAECAVNVTAAPIPVKVDAATPLIAPFTKLSYTYTVDATANALTVAATVSDGGSLSYQWYSSGTDSNEGGTAITGATSDSYTPPTDTVGTTYYYCVVTNTNEEATGVKTAAATSGIVAVTVEAAVDAAVPDITTQPVGGAYTVGNTAAALTVAATVSDDGSLSYQWYSNDTNSTEDGTAITGATSDSYTPPTDTVGTTYYYCVVTNTNEEATGVKTAAATSNAAAIAVKPEVPATPTITTQPVGDSYTVGATANALTVAATVSDGGNLNYQWYRNSTDSNTGGSFIYGATGSSYTPPTNAVGTSYYYCVVTNSGAQPVTSTDLSGRRSVASDVAAVVVKPAEGTAPDAPTIDPLGAGDSVVLGWGTPGNTITVTWPDGGTSTATADDEGYWFTFNPSGDALVPGDTVTAIQTDPATGLSSEEATATVGPNINWPVYADDKTITGTGVPDSTVTVFWPNNTTDLTTVGSATVNNDGTWSIDMPANMVLPDGALIIVAQTGADGAPIEGVSASAASVSPAAPAINSVTAGVSAVTGKGTPGNTVTVTWPGGGTSTATIADTGAWSVSVPSGVTLTAGNSVSVTQTYILGYGTSAATPLESRAATVTVNSAPAPVVPPSGGVSTCVVTFNSNGGSAVPSQTIAQGSAPVIPTNPTKDGCTFAGWYTDTACTTPYDGSVLRTDTTLYAKWTETVVPPTTTVPDIFTTDHIAYVNGYPDGTFRPTASLTRAEAAMAIYRLLKDDLKTGTAPAKFSDVSASDWYGTAVDTLAKMDILKGYSDGTFRPNAPITRAEMAALVSRFSESTATTTVSYSDVSTSHWAYDAIMSATANGWLLGDGNGQFRPDDNINRAEFVTLMNRVLDRQVQVSGLLPNIITFSDVSNLNWAYTAIEEAANGHTYTRAADGSEAWATLTGGVDA